MFILCCYYIVIILITFFRKKSNIKKLEILTLMGRGSVCRANDTLKHPRIHIYVIWPYSITPQFMFDTIFLLYHYYIVNIMLLFLPKKVTKKSKSIANERAGRRIGRTIRRHTPHILYVCHFRKPTLSHISFFSFGIRFPDEYPSKRVCFRVPQCRDIFFGLPLFRKVLQLWRKFPLCRAIFRPIFSQFPAENH